MDLISISPFQVASVLWRHADGSWVQSILCKATLDLRPGVATLAERQEPPNQENSYWNGDPSGSLHAARDLVPTKPRADVLLVGRAFAPRGKPARSLVARLTVGTVDKSIEVFGERSWTADGNLPEPAPFTAMPLVYERAAGGPETANPVGVITGPRALAQGLTRMPNLQIMGLAAPERSTIVAPVGFGPIASSWPERRRRLGALAGSWPSEGWNRRPMPEDLDMGYFNAAPDDQQIETLADDARIVLENLHWEHARLETVLPGVRPRARLEIPNMPQQEVRMRCDTLWIDSDRAVATVVWRGQVSLRRPDEIGRVVVVMEEPRRMPAWGAVGPANDGPGRGPERALELTAAMRRLPLEATAAAPQPISETRAAVLPFAPQGRGESDSQAVSEQRASAPESIALPIQPAPSSPLIAPSPVGPSSEDERRPAQPADPAPEGSAPAFSSEAASAREDRSSAPVAIAPPLASPSEVIELLWFDPELPGQLRRHNEWRKLLGAARDRPRNDDDSPSEKAGDKERRDILAIFKQAPSLDAGGLERAVKEATADGVFTPPLVVVSGRLEFLFDEVETLKATLVAVRPFAVADERLKETVASAREVLQTPGFEHAGALADSITLKVREAFGDGHEGLPAGDLDTHVERMLLQQRHYQRRTLWGDERIRALLRAGGEPCPAYLPAAVARQLPPARSLRARLLAELNLLIVSADRAELSMRILALAAIVR